MMRKNSLILLTLIFIAGISALFFVNLSDQEKELYLSPNYVNGSATEKNGILWTLNFDQQNELITMINSAEVYEGEISSGSLFSFDRVVIYRFDQPDLTITPIGLVDGRLLFSTSDGVLIENDPGSIENLLAETYDK